MFLQIYDSPDMEAMLADFTGRAEGVKFGTNRHGFSVLTVDRVPMPLSEAFEVYEWPGTPHVVVSDNATETVWEGRLEDINIIAGGVSLAAFGYQRALSDVPYTALWSKTGSGGWRPVPDEEIPSRTPDRYEMDNNNRLYIAPRKGETFGHAQHTGTMVFMMPHRGLTAARNFMASYDMRLPSGWQFRVLTYNEGFTSPTVVNTITATGSAQSGSLNLSINADYVVVDVRNNTGSEMTISDETGVNYLRLVDLLVKATGVGTSIEARNLVYNIADYVATVNPAQIVNNYANYTAVGTVLSDELYEDEFPDAILDRLALLHQCEWRVWEGRQLWFHPAKVARREWYVDVVEIVNLGRSLDNVRNTAYGIYRDAGGRTLRTLPASDPDSQARYGIHRRGFVQAQTTSVTEAETYRDAFLDDRADDQARARIVFDRLYDATGTQWPLWACRAGDSITMRNLPPTLSTEIDRIRTFMVGETDFDADAGELSVSPLEPTPSLVTLVARRGAGYRNPASRR